MAIRTRPLWIAASVVAGLALASTPGRGQVAKAPVRPSAGDDVSSKAATREEKVAGVVYKIEASEPNAKEKRLRINSSIPWADYVRDQAESAARAKATPPKAEAAKAIAVLGHPRDNDVVLLVDATRETTVETRFRSSTDDATKGAKSPEAALKVEEQAVDPQAKSKAGQPAAAKTTSIADLKEGEFVEIVYTHADARNRADQVTILRPVDRNATPAEEGNTRAPAKSATRP